MSPSNNDAFTMFSMTHVIAMFVLGLSIILLYFQKNKRQLLKKHSKLVERSFALSLLIMDIFYYVWLITTDRWNLSDSLPLELCSISLILTMMLLWTGSNHIYPFVFYAGIGGALQAVITPVLDMDFPHFRYFHFFYTHFGIMIAALYFTWVKGYFPTFKGILQTMLFLNLLLPIILFINYLTQGNYMFLKEKPSNSSLLDLLGPYPWYILSLELIAFFIFLCLWLLFKKKVQKKST